MTAELSKCSLMRLYLGETLGCDWLLQQDARDADKGLLCRWLMG